MTSSEQNVQYFGTTPPVSYALPTAAEVQFNNDMEMYLSSRGDVYESPEGQQNRARVVDKLNVLIVEWASGIGKAKNMSELVCSNGGGIQLKIFGSTRLGVHTPDADIDALCIAPCFIERSDFFGSFCTMLKSREDIGMLSAVPDAYTPVVKFNIDGQAIDMIFVSLQIHSIPIDIDVLDSRYLKGLDEQGIRSLNGSRVAEWICRLVPNFASFCTTLRFIKHWARQRGLYSNVLGFLGGVNYAVLVGFVCQRFPNACPATLVRKFFQVYTQWRWPNPIMLTGIEDRSPSETDGRYLPVWNPKINPKDGLHVMPIITPAFPSMNSSYNVGLPQFRLIQEEIQRGQMIFQSNKSNVEPFPWQMMCVPAVCDFFLRHPRYIQVDITANDAEDHRSWFGWCESRLRLLILSLEQPPMIFCHPQANCFHRRLPLMMTSAPKKSADNTNPVSINGKIDVNNDNLNKNTEINGHENISSPSSSSIHPQSDDKTSLNPSNESKGFSPKDSNKFRPFSPPQILTLVEPEIQSEITMGGTCFVSSFFIGLSFCSGLFAGNVGPAIHDFLSRVNIWDGKKNAMDITVMMRSQDEIPDFVFETKAEPSNMKACTPAKTNKNSGNDEVATRRSGKKLDCNPDDYGSPVGSWPSATDSVKVDSDSNRDHDHVSRKTEEREKDLLYSGPSAQFASRLTEYSSDPQSPLLERPRQQQLEERKKLKHEQQQYQPQQEPYQPQEPYQQQQEFEGAINNVGNTADSEMSTKDRSNSSSGNDNGIKNKHKPSVAFSTNIGDNNNDGQEEGIGFNQQQHNKDNLAFRPPQGSFPYPSSSSYPSSFSQSERHYSFPQPHSGSIYQSMPHQPLQQQHHNLQQQQYIQQQEHEQHRHHHQHHQNRSSSFSHDQAQYNNSQQQRGPFLTRSDSPDVQSRPSYIDSLRGTNTPAGDEYPRLNYDYLTSGGNQENNSSNNSGSSSSGNHGSENRNSHFRILIPDDDGVNNRIRQNSIGSNRGGDSPMLSEDFQSIGIRSQSFDQSRSQSFDHSNINFDNGQQGNVCHVLDRRRLPPQGDSSKKYSNYNSNHAGNMNDNNHYLNHSTNSGNFHQNARGRGSTQNQNRNTGGRSHSGRGRHAQPGNFSGTTQGGIANNEMAPISSSSSYVSSTEAHDQDASVSSQMISAPETETLKGEGDTAQQQSLFAGSPQKKLKKEFQADDHERLNTNNADLLDQHSRDITTTTVTDN